MDNLVALGIATVVLYSTGHWIGGTILLAWFAVGAWQDPVESHLEYMRQLYQRKR